MSVENTLQDRAS